MDYGDYDVSKACHRWLHGRCGSRTCQCHCHNMENRPTPSWWQRFAKALAGRW